MDGKKTVHMIGSAHIDPVWLWRFQDGFAEVKATFRSALDRISECDDFIFTSACAYYYKWVEENCPDMFEEIREAVKNGKWAIVGGMWIQPDCNMPSSESFARHFLYSQRYFLEKFGIKVITGYNVDSFGHSAGLPRLFRAAGIENYIYMRPSPYEEMSYPFEGEFFNWKCGEDSVKTFRIPDNTYTGNFTDDSRIKKFDEMMTERDNDIMLFYGVGNHGGGPTITNLKIINAYREHSVNEIMYSSPDICMSAIDESKIPTYEGELQNHASGCYSANSSIKAINRACENRLHEAESMETLASVTAGFKSNIADDAKAWQTVLFNQFHDILCGCSMRTAYDDALAFGNAAKAHALGLTNAAAQKISWSIDTSKGEAPRTKESHWMLWEAGNLGTPIVVFNPLSHPAKVPATINTSKCAAVTDENGNPVPFQLVRGEYTNGNDLYITYFREEVPAFGWKTFWLYREREFDAPETNGKLHADEHSITNGIITVLFDEESGGIKSIKTEDGKTVCGKTGTILVDDSENDTWAHNKFVFDKKTGEFGAPSFKVVENGPCRASVKVTQVYNNSTLEQIYSVYSDSAKVEVKVHLILNEALVIVKHCFDTELTSPRFIREVPGGVASVPISGRELPMLRWMLMEESGCGIAVINDQKYSSSADGSEMCFIGARSCYFGDHFGNRDDRMRLQDIGEHEYGYEIVVYDGDMSAIVKEAEEFNAEYPVISETYHKGTLPLTHSEMSISEGASVTAVKPAEDGDGIIIRIAETSGKNTSCHAEVFGFSLDCELTPNKIRTFRISEGKATECDLCEYAL